MNLDRACPICGDNSSVILLVKGSLHLVRCLRCQMVYATPVPWEYGDGSFYSEIGKSFYVSALKATSDYAPIRYERELRLIHRYCSAGTLLDVGCGTGGFLFNLQQAFAGDYEAWGNDISTDALDYAETKGVKVIRESFLSETFPAKFFDVITFWAVLEHVIEPRPFLNKAAKLLKPNGLCFVMVPNFSSVAVRILRAKYRYILPQHLNYFTARTLRRLAGESFEIVRLRGSHFNPFVIWEDLRGKRDSAGDEKRVELLARTNRLKEASSKPIRAAYSGVERVLSWLMLSDNILAVLRRKL